MNMTKKIILHVALWLGVTGLCFGYIFPKAIAQIRDLQFAHAKQLVALNELRDYARSLQRMEQDLDKLSKEQVQPEQLFTSDLKLVREIQEIEKIAAQTNNDQMKLSLSGTAEKAPAYPGASGLSQIPFTITLTGSFPDALRFIEGLENTYFVAPINAVSFTLVEGKVNTTIISNFIIRKEQPAPNQEGQQ